MPAIPLWKIRTYRNWKERQRRKCIVTIDHPRMMIKGKPHQNETDDPNFPTFMAFFGVPYATPPVGDLRFQPPQPLEVDSRKIPLLKAYKTDHACIQYDALRHDQYGDEDCLYLNIYMAKKPEEMPNNLPVLVYIHGGGFQHGSGDIYEIRPDAIVKQNLIFVTVNYRLSVYGFLNMDTELCRGNAGLKDQVQALKWIRDNIDRFGGDPHNVTITGHSAGATCVNLHMISPLSEGLFQKAILMGGGIYCPWGYERKQKRLRRLLAKEYGMDNELRHVLTQVLLDENANELIEITKWIANDMIRLSQKKMLIFCGPSLERIKTDAFIPDEVEELMKRAKPVPFITGIAEQEGYMYILVKWYRYTKGFDRLVKHDHEFVQFLMQNFRWSKKTALRLKDTLRNKYFPRLERMTSQQIQEKLASFNTDIWYRRFYDNFKLGTKNAPYYVYNFWYIANHDKMRYTECGTAKIRLLAPTHGDEINYLYNPLYLKHRSGGQIPPGMRRIMEHVCSLWGNFCKNGVPTSDVEPKLVWTPHTESQPRYLNIGASSVVIKARLHEFRWRELNEIVDAQPTKVSAENTPDDSPFDFLNPTSWGIPRPSLGTN